MCTGVEIALAIGAAAAAGGSAYTAYSAAQGNGEPPPPPPAEAPPRQPTIEDASIIANQKRRLRIARDQLVVNPDEAPTGLYIKP